MSMEKEFSVALLMDDIHEAKNISEVLREVGIFAHFYQNLDEYWVAINTHTPDFSIIDVTKMSQGSLLFKNHPKVESGALSFCFYYKDDTRILLNSTYSLFHYGYMKKEINLKGQIQNILRRRNEELKVLNENELLNKRLERLQKRSTQLVSDAQDSYNFESQYQLLMTLVRRLEGGSNTVSFSSKLIQLFCDWEHCKSFGVYELNKTGQKLIAENSSRPKYVELPPLWLGQTCDNGMESFAISMAEQVAMDQVIGDPRTIKISGQFFHPDIIIIASMDEGELTDFQWQLFESQLSSLYRQHELELKSPSAQGSHYMTTWEAMAYMDDIHYHQVTSEFRPISIDLSGLIEVIEEKHSNRFYWKDFFNDFIYKMSEALGESSKFTNFGVNYFLVFLNHQDLEKDFQALSKFVTEFNYWRYFEDSSLILTKNTIPELKVIAPSSVNMLRTIAATKQIDQDVTMNMISHQKQELASAFRQNFIDQ